MALPDPLQYLAHAEAIMRTEQGRPLQVNLRRAISAAYYGLFHAILTAVADLHASRSAPWPRYKLVYRSVSHRSLLQVCEEVSRNTPRERFKDYLSSGGLGKEMRVVSKAVVNLQERRHEADYDPERSFKLIDARAAIEIAREALDALKRAIPAERDIFLTLILCPPR